MVLALIGHRLTTSKLCFTANKMQFNGIQNEMLTIQMTWPKHTGETRIDGFYLIINTQGRQALMGFTLSLYKQFGFVTVISHTLM